MGPPQLDLMVLDHLCLSLPPSPLQSPETLPLFSVFLCGPTAIPCSSSHISLRDPQIQNSLSTRFSSICLKITTCMNTTVPEEGSWHPRDLPPPTWTSSELHSIWYLPEPNQCWWLVGTAELCRSARDKAAAPGEELLQTPQSRLAHGCASSEQGWVGQMLGSKNLLEVHVHA